MKRVQMPVGTNEQVVFTKRSLKEAWPNMDEETFRRQLLEADAVLRQEEDRRRAQRRADFAVSCVVGGCLVFCLILLVSGA